MGPEGVDKERRPIYNRAGLEVLVAAMVVLHGLTGDEDPYTIMANIEPFPGIGDLQSSSVNGAAEVVALMSLGAKLALLPRAEVVAGSGTGPVAGGEPSEFGPGGPPPTGEPLGPGPHTPVDPPESAGDAPVGHGPGPEEAGGGPHTLGSVPGGRPDVPEKGPGEPREPEEPSKGDPTGVESKDAPE